LSVPDNRGSAGQRYLFDLCIKIYPANRVEWELYIPDTNQRFDIFLIDYGIAIEYQGRQHYEYVEHFHKDDLGYIDSIKKDRIKLEWATNNGIVILYFDDSNMPKDENELREIINLNIKSTNYSYTVFDKPKNKILDEAKQYRKNMYQKIKNNK